MASTTVAPAQTPRVQAVTPPVTPPQPTSVSRSQWAEIFAKAQNTAINDVGITVYNKLIEQRVVNTYGGASGFSLSERQRAMDLMNGRILDSDGPAVFIGEVRSLLQDPQVRTYLTELRRAIGSATRENPVSLWEFTLARAGSEREATRWIATLLQDFTPEILQGQGFIRMVEDDQRGHAVLLDTLKAVAAGVRSGALQPYPQGWRFGTGQFYHYYVPRYLAQRLVDEGVPRNLAFLAVGTFNLEYELLAPALMDQRHDQVLEDVAQVFTQATGITRQQLDARVAELRAKGEVNSEFVFADLDLERDLRLTPQQIERFLAQLGERFGVTQAQRDTVVNIDGKSLHRMTQMVTASQFANFLRDKSLGGLVEQFVRPGYAIYTKGVQRPVLITRPNLADVYLGFAGGAAVLPNQRMPFNEQQLSTGLLRMGPGPFMSQMYRHMGPTAGDELAQRSPGDSRATASAIVALHRRDPAQARVAVEQLLARQSDPRGVARRLLQHVSDAPEVETALRRAALVGLDTPAQQDTQLATLTRLVGRDGAQVAVGIVDQSFNIPDARERAARNAPRNGIDLIDNDSVPYVQYGFGIDSVATALRWTNPPGDLTTQHGSAVMDIAVRGTDALVPIPIRSGIHGVVEAIRHAARNGARVVNISQEMVAATPQDLEKFRAALREHPEVLVVMSAGNRARPLGDRELELAAIDEPNFVKVAGATSDGRLSARSSFHPTTVQFVARGGSRDPALYASRPWSSADNALRNALTPEVEATSHAGPAVANIAAKVRLLAPQLSSAEVVALLAQASDTTDTLRARARYGVIDRELALSLAATLALARAGASPADAVRRVAEAQQLPVAMRRRVASSAAALTRDQRFDAR